MSAAKEGEVLRFPAESGCFGCSTHNPAGLQLTFRREGDTILCEHTIHDRFHGAPGIAHGGIVATIFDELSCAAVVFLRDRYVVTGELSVRYNLPCPVEKPLRFVARISAEAHSKYAEVACDAYFGAEHIARSTGKFFYVERNVSAP
jgi:acyl-coenzyme A thioesterase PaaI-like protein